MKYTSAEANKLLKTLEKKRDSVLGKERKAAKFMVSSTEDIEELRPAYNFSETQKEIAELNEKIRTVSYRC